MYRDKNKSLFQLGGVLIAAGIAIYLAQFMAHLLIPIAGLCIVVGAVLAVISLVMPRR